VEKIRRGAHAGRNAAAEAVISAQGMHEAACEMQEALKLLAGFHTSG
jgi:hypothetical protein